MITLNQCLEANRPITFVVAESDLELLQYINNNKTKKEKWSVYSSTLAGLVPLSDVLDVVSAFSPIKRATSTLEVLQSILDTAFNSKELYFEKILFLDAQMYLNDLQNVRKIKDIVSKYQIDENFTVNLIFVTQSIFVPPLLERLGEVIFYPLPDEYALKDLSAKITKNLKLKKEPDEEVINNLKGLTLFEAEQAYLQSFGIYKNIELSFIRDFKKNSIAKTDLLTLQESNISFNDVGGMEKLKEWIKKSYGGWTVEGKKFGLPLLKGLLLVGLPGCGKSLTFKAIGNEWGLPVVQFDPSRVFSSRVGDSESNMRRVLSIVETLAPCILAVDEIEKGFSGIQSSTFSDAGVTARVIGSFLVWMQECTKPVFIVATSNNIQYLPPELINRFDETFFVNLPQYFERIEIFKIHIRKLNRDPSKIDLEALAEHSKNLSGREIEQVLREAMYDAYQNKTDISTETVLNVLSKKTNLITTMAEQLQYLLTWVGLDEERNDGIRARFASTPDQTDMSRIRAEINTILKSIDERENPNERENSNGRENS